MRSRPPPKARATPQPGDELRMLAAALEKTDEEASRVELTVPELQGARSEYLAMVRAVAKSARDIADAAEAKDVAGIAKGQAAMEEATRLEDAVVNRINRICVLRR